MKSLINKVIIVKIKENKIKKYFYQLNGGIKVYGIEMDPKEKVSELKKSIGKLNDVHHLSSIKILLDGKDLANGDTLNSLDIGNRILYVHILTDDDFLVMSSKSYRLADFADFKEETESDSF